MANVDPKEIAKFSSNDHWWDTNGAFKPLHDINPIRLAFIQQQAALSDKTVLDIGCGGGILAESLAKSGAKVTGIDLNEQALTQAKAHATLKHLDMTYELTSVEDFAHSPQQFDVITCMELLEHVPDPSSIIKAAKKLIKPHGQLFFSTINRNPKAFLLAIVGAEYVLNYLPKGTHSYQKFIRPSELSAWLRQQNLIVTKIAGMQYNTLTKIYRLTNDPSVNYLLAAKAL